MIYYVSYASLPTCGPYVLYTTKVLSFDPPPTLSVHTNYCIIDSIRCAISIIRIFSLTLLAKQTSTNWTQYFFMCNVNLIHIQYVLKNIKISMIWWGFLYTRASFTYLHTLRLLPVFEKNRQIKLHHKARFLG